MKVQNIVRKAVALGSGAALVGTTLMGALAYDLSTYPAKFIVDGKFDGKIVVGEKAATPDVIGAIDIAASLQGASVSKVPIPGAAGQISLEGDNFKIGTSSDMLELREPLGKVVDTVTSDDLTGLKSGKLQTPKGSTNYAQYLRLRDGANVQDMTVNYVRNEKASDRAMGDYLIASKSDPFLEWEVQFDQGFESKWDSTTLELKDLQDRTFNIMGTDFAVVSATVDDSSGTPIDFEMTLMGGSVPDTLREGETKTYTINGVDYEVTLVFVSDPASAGNPEVKFSVNGELTQALATSETDVLSGGLQIGVRDILVNAREGVASFYLGAHKLALMDTELNDDVFTTGSIEVNDDTNEDDVLDVTGTFPTASSFEITSMKYVVKMKPAAGGEIVYIPKGHGIRELVDKPELLLSDTLNIRYEGLTVPQTTPVTVDPTSGDEEYTLSFTNIDGKTYDTVPLLSTSDGLFKYGEKTDDLVFVESAGYPVGIDDYFIVTSKSTVGDEYKAVTNVLQYDGYNSDQRTLDLTDLADNTKVSTVLDVGGEGTIKIGGHSYPVAVADVAVDDSDLTVDFDGDGTINVGEFAKVTTWGGLVIDLADLIYSGATSNDTTMDLVNGNGLHIGDVLPGQAAVRMTGAVDTSLFDTAGGETFEWTIAETADQTELRADFDQTSYTGPLTDVLGNPPFDEFQFNDKTRNSDLQAGMTDYGILIEQNDPSSSNDNARTLTFTVPQEQVSAQVFVTLGDVSAVAGGSGTADKVNPIAVGLAVLDKDAPAIGTENLIVVGGPCANTVAAALMNNPAVCTDGFESGKAIIKASEQGGKVAILVAGYSAQDTQGASRVLAAYKDYSLTGSEVEVVVADLNSIKVNPLT